MILQKKDLSGQEDKVGGYIIFDDCLLYIWDSVIKGVEMFLIDHISQLEIIANPTDCHKKYGHSPQFIVRRVS